VSIIVLNAVLFLIRTIKAAINELRAGQDFLSPAPAIGLKVDKESPIIYARERQKDLQFS